MFDSLIQYPMGVDYCLAMVHAVQVRKLEFPLTLDGSEIRSYLNRYRRSDENVFIPDGEIPDRIRYERVDLSGLVDSDGGVKGSILIGRMVLEWLGPKLTPSRETGPARITIDQFKVCFFRGDIYGVNAITADSIDFKWYRDGVSERFGGPHTIKMHSFKMDRINNLFQNPRFNASERDGLYRWAPVRNHDILRFEVYRDIVKQEKLILRMYTVHGPVFQDSMVEYLFWEEVYRRERNGLEVYTK